MTDWNVKDEKIKEEIVRALETCYDPEIPVNIYELGLIYHVEVDDAKNLNLKMTLTSPACPVAGILPGEVESKMKAIPEINNATVELVWEPSWNPAMMSDVAKLELGFM